MRQAKTKQSMRTGVKVNGRVLREEKDDRKFIMLL